MKLIQLTQGKFAQVDDWWFDKLSQYKWFAHKKKYTYYVGRNSKTINGKRHYISMHRVIMNTPVNKDCDHQDHNGLNCQEFNLRNCTQIQNSRNMIAKGKSKYIGVTLRSNGRIIARIYTDKRRINLGDFKSEIEAAKSRDLAAVRYHGEFANLNFPEKKEEYLQLISIL